MIDQQQGKDAWSSWITSEKYVVFDPCGDVEFFSTLEKAEEYIKDMDLSDGIPDEFINGELAICKVVRRSALKITDHPGNYPKVDEYGDTIEWPHDPDFVWVGDIEMLEV